MQEDKRKSERRLERVKSKKKKGGRKEIGRRSDSRCVKEMIINRRFRRRLG